jgi:general secretion pathway protein A
MYRDFYGLNRNAFELSPDPFFFFPTRRHNEALANLSYGVRWRKGFVVITGEVGTGKTLLLRCLLDLLSKVQIACAYIFNTRMTPLEFFQYLLRDLNVPTRGTNKAELLHDLEDYLIGRHRRGSTTVLIVDEGQLLSWDLLEEIRLLGNLETSQEKLLQIVLVGQPELDAKLDSPDLRQLHQRIGLRCRLEPLGREEMKQYIRRRLELAGAIDLDLFPEATLEEIYKYSQGIPRIVNTICENALISGCVQKLRSIAPEGVQEVAADFHLTLPQVSGERSTSREVGAAPKSRVRRTSAELSYPLHQEVKPVL